MTVHIEYFNNVVQLSNTNVRMQYKELYVLIVSISPQKRRLVGVGQALGYHVETEKRLTSTLNTEQLSAAEGRNKHAGIEGVSEVSTAVHGVASVSEVF